MRNLKKSFYRNNKLLFVLCLLLTIIGVGITLVFAFLIQYLLDIASSGNAAELPNALYLALGLLVGSFVINILTLRCKWAFIKKAMLQYKNEAFQIIASKNISSFASETTSSYLSILTNDATVIEESYLRSIFSISGLSVSFLGAIALMFWYNWLMTLIVLFSCALPIGISILFAGKIAALQKEISNKNEGFVAVIKDILSGFTVIKSFRAENVALKLYQDKNRQVENEKEKVRNSEGTLTVLSQEAGSVLQIGIFIVGTILSLNGKMTVGVVIAFVQLMNNVMEPIQVLPTLYAKRKAANALIEKMEHYANSNEVVDGDTEIDSLNHGIEFKELSFAYDNKAEKALDTINLHFEQGKSYALVGESGSGKSTLLKLLLRSYLDYDGNILIDNVELNNINTSSLYNLLAIVQQDVFIFNGTIKDNITLYQDVKEDKLNKAIQAAGLNSLIDKRGLDFACGENGNKLSGGEKQRISIARALLKDTQLFLMDEATSALDAETAQTVLHQILSLTELTRIIITHNLKKSDLIKFDQIVVLKDGQIVEKGTYQQLMAKKDYFYSLCTIALE